MARSSLSDEASAAFAKAKSVPLCGRLPPIPALDRRDIEGLLPQHGTLLLLDSVSHVDLGRGLLCARYDLARARELLSGHFPGEPVYPGVLQVEAIGQAGALLHTLSGDDGGTSPEKALLVHILGARFRHRVEGTGTLGITVTVFDDDLLFTTVGQTIHCDRVCTAAAMSSIVDDP